MSGKDNEKRYLEGEGRRQYVIGKMGSTTKARQAHSEILRDSRSSKHEHTSLANDKQ